MSAKKCLLCEDAIRPYEPFTAALATNGKDDGLINMPVHFSCFAEMISGEVTRSVLRGMKGRDFPEYVHDGDLRDGLMRAAMEFARDILQGE